MSACSWSDGGLCHEKPQALRVLGVAKSLRPFQVAWRRLWWVFIEEIGPIITDKRLPASGPRCV